MQIRQHDHPLPKAYLDRAAMKDHQFLAVDYPDIDLPYNLVFSVETRDVIPLPAPALFDYVARNGYRVMPKDIVTYQNNLAAAQAEPQQWDPMVPIPQHFNIGPHGFYDW